MYLLTHGYAWDDATQDWAEPTVLFGDRPGPATTAEQASLPDLLDKPDDQQNRITLDEAQRQIRNPRNWHE